MASIDYMTPYTQPTLALIEDNADWCEIVATALSTSSLQLKDIFHSGEDALQSLQSGCHHNYYLVDIQLPGMDGLEFISKLLQISPQARPILFTMHENSDLIFRAIQLGIVGYILKDANTEEIKKD